MREYRVVPTPEGWQLEYPEPLTHRNRDPLESVANRLMRHEPGAIKLTVCNADGSIDHEVTRGGTE